MLLNLRIGCALNIAKNYLTFIVFALINLCQNITKRQKKDEHDGI